MRQNVIISKQHTLYQGVYIQYIYRYIYNLLLSTSNLASCRHMSNYTEAWLIKLTIKQRQFCLSTVFFLPLPLPLSRFLSLICVCWGDGEPPTSHSLIKSGVNNNGCRVAHVAWTQTWMRAVKWRAERLRELLWTAASQEFTEDGALKCF